jgi:hypothetical protein
MVSARQVPKCCALTHHCHAPIIYFLLAYPCSRCILTASSAPGSALCGARGVGRGCTANLGSQLVQPRADCGQIWRDKYSLSHSPLHSVRYRFLFVPFRRRPPAILVAVGRPVALVPFTGVPVPLRDGGLGLSSEELAPLVGSSLPSTSPVSTCCFAPMTLPMKWRASARNQVLLMDACVAADSSNSVNSPPSACNTLLSPVV